MVSEIIKTINDSLLVFENHEIKRVLTYYLPNESSYIEFSLDYEEKLLSIKLVKISVVDGVIEDEIDFSLEPTRLFKLESIISEILNGKQSISELLSIVHYMKKLKEEFNIDDDKAFEISLAINYIEKGLSAEQAIMISQPTIISIRDLIECPLYTYSVIKTRSKKNLSTFTLS